VKTIRVFTMFAVSMLTILSHCNVYALGSQYEAHGKRDPFVSLVGPEKTTSLKLEDIMSVDDVRLEGIATGAKGSMTAIINGEILKQGDKVGEVEMRKISTRSVTIAIGGNTYEIKLPEQGGAK